MSERHLLHRYQYDHMGLTMTLRYVLHFDIRVTVIGTTCCSLEARLLITNFLNNSILGYIMENQRMSFRKMDTVEDNINDP